MADISVYTDLAVLERCPLDPDAWRHRVRILVDGVPVGRCYAADEGAGTADCFMRDRRRRIIIADREPVRMRYHGRVTVVAPPAVREWLEAYSPSREARPAGGWFETRGPTNLLFGEVQP